jgi:hypothetical protein
MARRKIMNMAAVESHVRLTASEVKELYLAGYLPGHTYLDLLLRALKAPGWANNIDSVTDFCEKWGINERAFYRAKARLVADGIMTEEIKGVVRLTMHSNVAPDRSVSTPVRSVSTPDRSVSTPDRSVSTPDRSVSTPDRSVSTPDRSVKIDPQNPIEISGSGDSPDLYQISINSYSDLSQVDRGKKTEKAQISKRDRDVYSEQFEKWWDEYRDFCTCVNAKPGSKKEAWEEWSKNELFFSGQHFQDCDQIYRRREIARLASEGRVYGIKHGCRYLRSDEWENAFYAARRSAEMGVDFSDPAAVRQAVDVAAKQKSRDRLMELARERGYA